MKKSAAAALVLSLAIGLSACEREQSSSSDSSLPQETTKASVTFTETVSQSAKAPKESETTVQTEATTYLPTVFWSDIPDICSSRYGYYLLNADEKTVYDQIAAAARAFQTNVVLKKRLSREDVIKIISLMRLEEVDLYYISREYNAHVIQATGMVTAVDLSYDFTKTEVENLNRQVDQKVSEILMRLPADATPEAKIKVFHDTIVLSTDYSLNYKYGATPYGPLVGGQALCEGYAKAFALLCNKVGIENLFVTGSYNGEDHLWNMVKLDGNWYNIDTTWDDPPYDGEEKNPDYYIQYNYFLYKNNEAGVDLVVNNNLFPIPQTNSNKYNYFIYYGYYAESYEQAKKIIANQVQYSLKTGKKFIRLKLSSHELYEETLKKLRDDKDIYDENVTPKDSVKKYIISQFENLNIIQLEIFPNNQ